VDIDDVHDVWYLFYSKKKPQYNFLFFYNFSTAFIHPSLSKKFPFVKAIIIAVLFESVVQFSSEICLWAKEQAASMLPGQLDRGSSV